MSSFGDTDGDSMTIGTATEALLSKLYASRRGYFKDEFLSHLCSKEPPKKPPIINRGYFARVECIRSVIAQFDKSCIEKGCMFSQMIIVGSGYDSLSLNILKSGRTDVAIFEIDFPEVIRRKASLLFSKPELKSTLFPAEDGSSSIMTAQTISNGFKAGQLTLLGVDLRDTDRVVEALRSSSFDSSAPTLIVSECVLVYMEKEDVCRLIQRSVSISTSRPLPKLIFIS